MSNESRRKLLKSIAAGSGAIVAGKSLPESWSRPIIDSVLLPAHATTSQATLVIPGATRTCNAGDAVFSTEYYIDHSGAVPVLVQGVTPAGPANRMVVDGTRSGTTETLNYTIATFGWQINIDCPSGAIFSIINNYTEPVIDTAGIGWTATFFNSRTASTRVITLSDIVLTQN